MFATAALLLAVTSASAAPPSGCVNAGSFTGTICAPASPGKHAAIVLLGGSEGGNSMERVASRFAQYGYVAASVAYFGIAGLPQALENVPVETVGKALDEVSRRPDVDANRIAVMGISKGGEFALLAASTYPQIHAVVAVVPSPFAWEGIPQGPGEAGSSWTLNGKPVPYVHYTSAMGTLFGEAFATHKPLDLRKGYDDAMRVNGAQIPGAMFRLENIRGPILLLAADDDRIWNSPAQCEIAVRYLREHHHPFADGYVHYAGAGHLFLFSSRGRALTQVPEGPVTFLMGGSPQANVDAGNQAWSTIAKFLQDNLR